MIDSTNRRATLIWICFLLLAFACGTVTAQDEVTVRGKTGKIVKRKGQITEWKGVTLSINVNGRNREIDQSEIIQFQTAWSADYLKGQKLLNAHDYKGAAESFVAALKSDPRVWAQQIIRSKLVQCYAADERWPEASKHFLTLLRDDPETRFMNLIPIPWGGGLQSAGMTQASGGWMRSKIPAVELLGASWLVSGKFRDDALAKLEELVKDLDPNVAAMAQAQLWRARGITATAIDLKTVSYTHLTLPTIYSV